MSRVRSLAFAFALAPQLLAGAAVAQVTDLTESLPADPSTVEKTEGVPDFADPPDAGAVQKAWDRPSTRPSILDVTAPRSAVTRVMLREGAITTIEFPTEILEPVIGDSAHFAYRIGADRSKLHVYPTAVGFDTTGTVTTDDGLVYPFYFRALPITANTLPHTVVRIAARVPSPSVETDARFSRSENADESDDAESALASHADTENAPTWTRSDDFDPTKIRHDLEWSGDDAIAPRDAWRDDKFTYLFWGDDNDGRKWPSVWQVEDGIDKPVRVRRTKSGSMLIVETTGALTLRHGAKTVCIRPHA